MHTPKFMLRSINKPFLGSYVESFSRLCSRAAKSISLYVRPSTFFFPHHLPPPLADRTWYRPYHWPSRSSAHGSSGKYFFSSLFTSENNSYRVTSGDSYDEFPHVEQQTDQSMIAARETAYLRLFGSDGVWDGLAKDVAEVRYSPIHHRGIFAKCDIPKGTLVICQYKVTFCDAVAFALLIGDCPSRREALVRYMHPSGGVLQLPLSPNPVLLLNHACSPNVKGGFQYRVGHCITSQLKNITCRKVISSTEQNYTRRSECETLLHMLDTHKNSLVFQSLPEPSVYTSPEELCRYANDLSGSVQFGHVLSDPNCWITTRDVLQGEELTIDYNRRVAPTFPGEFESANPVLCLCAQGESLQGAKRCCGQIYPKIKQLSCNYRDHVERQEAVAYILDMFSNADDDQRLNQMMEKKEEISYKILSHIPGKGPEPCDEPLVALSQLNNRSSLLKALQGGMTYHRVDRLALHEQLDTALLYLNEIAPGYAHRNYRSSAVSPLDIEERFQTVASVASQAAKGDDRRVPMRLLQKKSDAITAEDIIEGANSVKQRRSANFK